MIKTIERLGCSETQMKALERVNYFPRQLLTVDDMVTESEYFRQKLRRHNLFLHGCGIVCGLEVKEAPEKNSSTVKISAGYALGPYGDEIYVAEPVFFDLAGCGSGNGTDPCEPSTPLNGSGVGATVYVVMKYAECFARPVRAMPAGCACDEEDCQYSRVRDSFQISCLTQPPPPPKSASLCEVLAQKVLPCPPYEISPWILLAQVTLPSATEKNMFIDPSGRPILVSTAALQKRLIECCCGDTADLDIKKTLDLSGQKYTIVVRNNGAAPAENVVVKDVFDIPGVSVKVDGLWKKDGENPGTTLHTNLGEVASGGSKLVELQLLTAISPGHNTAHVTTDTRDGTKGHKSASA
jgi:hypothetical protein